MDARYEGHLLHKKRCLNLATKTTSTPPLPLVATAYTANKISGISEPVKVRKSDPFVIVLKRKATSTGL